MTLDTANGTLSIQGNIITAEDFNTVKQALESMKSQNSIQIKIHDSLVMTSSLIGYLIKLINQDGKEVSVGVGNATLYELLEDLGLKQTFKVHKL